MRYPSMAYLEIIEIDIELKIIDLSASVTRCIVNS